MKTWEKDVKNWGKPWKHLRKTGNGCKNG